MNWLKKLPKFQEDTIMNRDLLSPATLGTLSLKSRVVLAPMRRSRTVSDNMPNDLMAEYYAQRSGAGLIITEGTSPSPNGVGYNLETAEAALKEGRGDLVAFGRPFISNPDFVTRLEKGLPLTVPDFSTFYTPGPEGYPDYPAFG